MLHSHFLCPLCSRLDSHCSWIPPQSTNEHHQSRVPEHSEQAKRTRLLRQLLACPLCFLDDGSSFWSRKSWLLPGWECLGGVHALSQCDWPHVASWIWQSTRRPYSWGSVSCLCGKGLGVRGLQEQLGGHLASSQGITDRLWLSLLGHSWGVLYCKGSEGPCACHCSEVLGRQTPPKSVCQSFPFQKGLSANPFLPLKRAEWAYPSADLKKCFQLLVLNT